MAASPTSEPSPRPDWTVIYDGDCGMCRTLLALLLRADTDRRLRPLALGTPEADRLLADLTEQQRNASWHLVDPSGHRSSAGAAGRSVLRLLPGAAPSAAAGLLDHVPQATERLYTLVASNRSAIGPWLPDSVKRRATAVVARRAGE